jgi:hypothetical protein
LEEDQWPPLVHSLRGLTLDEARRVLTHAILEESGIVTATIEAVHEAKTQLIKDHGVIEFLQPESGMGSVGGLAHLKARLEKRRTAFSAEAEKFGFDPPKGILIFGIQGCGKSLCTKAVAREWGLALLQFDSSELLEKYEGDSEKHLRQSLKVAEAVKSALYSAFDKKAPLSSAMLLEELRATYPLSVTMKEKIDALRAWAQQRAIPAN